MLYFNFKNYEEFKELFGMQKHGNGTKSRKNKILLIFIKNQELLHEAVRTGDYSLLHISSMAELKSMITDRIISSAEYDYNLPYRVQLLGRDYKSSIYETDQYQGICEDSDYKAIRYYNHSNDQTFKMKAGKFYKSLILNTEFGRKLPQQVVNFLCEEFVQDWQSHSLKILPKHTLFVNKDFERIYNSDYCKGDFGSCMMDRDYHYFYEYYVDASAAYLENEDSQVIARCIIFNRVTDEKGNIWRLAERQYSSECNTVLHRLLIDKLIHEGRIDGYKQIGVGCSDSRAFVDNDGNSLSDRKFSIRCTLEYNNTLSYQDSFKYLNLNDEIAYNYPNCNYNLALDTTDGEIERDEDEYEENEYDQYHQQYCYEVTTVFYGGEITTCDSNRLDDFIFIQGEYYHEDDVQCCPTCGAQFITDNGCYSGITDREYCCLECQEVDEQQNESEKENENQTNKEE